MWQTRGCAKQGARPSERCVIGRPFIALPSSPISHKMELVAFQPCSFQNKQLGEVWVRGVGDKPLGNLDPPVVGVVTTVSPSSEQIKLNYSHLVLFTSKAQKQKIHRKYKMDLR